MRAIINQVARVHPDEAAAASALLQQAVQGWNALHASLEGNLAVGACNNTQKFDKLDPDTAPLYLFIKMPGVCGCCPAPCTPTCVHGILQ